MTDHERQIMKYVEEILDRNRRIETRLTRYMDWQGFDVQSKMPRWDAGAVVIVSSDTSLRHILASIPPDWENRPVGIIHRGKESAKIIKLPE